MTRIQLISLIAVAGAAAWTYFPRSLRIPSSLSRIPSKKPPLLSHMSSVMEIRDTYESPEVKAAATALLQALLQAK